MNKLIISRPLHPADPSGAIIVMGSKIFFILTRRRLFAGAVEGSETALNCLYRELEKELGLTSSKAN